MDANHILESLNEAQQQAIKSDAKQSLILAGAGSGKTRVITHKVAWLSSILDINPMSIMTVTFTNKAAREMRGRIEGILGEQLQTMWCGTFHGLFHRMLKMHWQEAGLIKSFAILDGDDQLRVIKRVMKEMNIDLDQWPPSQVQWFINKQKEEGRRKAKISSNNSYLEEKMAEIYESYQAVCEAEGLVDFAEILLRSYELLNSLPHDRGTLSMARAQDPNSANSQFFICFQPAPFLDRQYTVFGKVIEGMEFVDKIKRGDQNNNGAVTDPDKIISFKTK